MAPTPPSRTHFAAAWARRLDLSLAILTVMADAPPPLRPDQHGNRYGTHGRAAHYIDNLMQQWHDHVPDITGRVLRDPIGPASAIRVHLDDEPAGLVAVTTHAASGMQRVVLGATAASIVHASVAPCILAPLRQ